MPNDGYARPELLVETGWLEAHLDDPMVRVVDCDVYEMYRRAHITNAVGIPGHHYIKHPNYAEDPKSYPLVMPPEPFTQLMEEIGIGNDTLVVAYDNAGSLYAARFWWVLSYYGHTNIRVLDGGWAKWFAEGRPMSLDVPRPSKESFTARQNADVVCSLEYGVSCVGQQDTVFLDVRTDGEWLGINDRGNARAGHVPGAVHLEWRNFVDWGTYPRVKPAHEIRAMLEERGVTPDKQVITY